MPTAKHAALAAAVILVWGAGPVLAQVAMGGGMSGPASAAPSLNDRPGERAGAVIRAIDNEDARVASAARVDVTELARARTAGEWQTMERGAPVQVERIQLDEPVRSGARADTQATTRGAAGARVSAKGADRPQIVRADSESSARPKTAAGVRLDDTQRYREQIRYDSAKKQRDTTATAATSERSAPGRIARGKVEITWSAPAVERDYRTANESEERTLY